MTSSFELDRMISELEDSFAGWCNASAADEPEATNRLVAARRAIRNAFAFRPAQRAYTEDETAYLLSQIVAALSGAP